MREPRHQLVVFSALPWAGHPQRQHELAARLATRFDVFFVEPPHASMQESEPEFGPLEARGHVKVVRPCISRSQERIASLVGIPQAWYRRKARSLQEELPVPVGARVLWLDTAASIGAIDNCREALCVYDCVDLDWTFTRWPWKRWLYACYEDGLAARSDVILCSSSSLGCILRRRARNVHTIPNACSLWHVEMRSGQLQESWYDERPTIGFIGGIHRRSIASLYIRNVAQRRPDWRFLLVGSYDRVLKRALEQLSNVELPGPISHQAAQDYIRRFDVCLIPYRTGANIDYVYPKKLHEYLAAGKPVVATDMPELRPFEGIIKIGRTPQEFADKIAESLAENADPALSARLAAERRAVAAENTWEKRVEQVVRILDEALRSKGFEGISTATPR